MRAHEFGINVANHGTGNVRCQPAKSTVGQIADTWAPLNIADTRGTIQPKRRVGNAQRLEYMPRMSKASEYRKEAEDLRNTAQATKDKIMRNTLLKLAAEYDRMAAYPSPNHPKELPRKTGW